MQHCDLTLESVWQATPSLSQKTRCVFARYFSLIQKVFCGFWGIDFVSRDLNQKSNLLWLLTPYMSCWMGWISQIKFYFRVCRRIISIEISRLKNASKFWNVYDIHLMNVNKWHNAMRLLLSAHFTERFQSFLAGYELWIKSKNKDIKHV